MHFAFTGCKILKKCDMAYHSRSVADVPNRGESVHLNIYDIHGVSRWTSALGLGLYHTGVVVFSHEFSYGGHDKVASGIYKIPPRNLTFLGDGMSYNTTINFGTTSRTQKEAYEYLCDLAEKYRGIDYNLLQQNCNHFADEFLYFLVKRHLPSFVNRVARSFHYVFSPIIPKSWVQYPCASSASSTSSVSNSDSSASPSQPPVSSSHAKNKIKSDLPPRPPPPKPPKVTTDLITGLKAGVAEMNFRVISNDSSHATNQNSRMLPNEFDDGDGGDSGNEWNDEPPSLPLRSRSLPRRFQNTFRRHRSEDGDWARRVKRSQSCGSSLHPPLTDLHNSSFWKFPNAFEYLD